jgi:hypothetical protein
MNATMPRTIVVCLLFLASVPGYAADATGYVRPEACDLMTGAHLHLEKLRGRKLNTPIVLEIPKVYGSDAVLNTWLNVPGMECVRPNQCQNATHSKIQVTRVSSRFSLRWMGRIIDGLSGNFEIDLVDGKNVEGSFKAKIRKPAKGFICE